MGVNEIETTKLLGKRATFYAYHFVFLIDLLSNLFNCNFEKSAAKFVKFFEYSLHVHVYFVLL